MQVFGTEFMWICQQVTVPELNVGIMNSWSKQCECKHMSVQWVMGMAKWDIVMCTCVFLKFHVHEIWNNAPNASYEPTSPKKKWPTCLGQNVWQLEKWVGVIPITVAQLFSGSKTVLCSGGEFLSVNNGLSVRQGTQHFTNENKVSRKWSDSVHLLPLKVNKNNTTTHQVTIVKIQNQKSIKLSYNIYYKTHSQLYMRPTINQ